MNFPQRFIAILFIAFIGTLSYSQTVKIDNLRHQLKTHNNKDSIRVNYLIAYGEEITIYDIEELKKCAQESEIISNKLNYKRGLAYSYLLYGQLYYNKSEYKLSLEYYTKAKQLLKSSPTDKGLADSYLGLGLNNYQLALYTQALDLFQESINISRKINYIQGISNAYNYIGICYIHKGDLNSALNALQKSLELITESEDNNIKANIYNNLGRVYRDLGDYDYALDYYQKALNIREVLDLKEGLSNSYNSLGIVYEIIGDYTKALEYFNKSLDLRELIGNPSRISGSYNNIGAIYKITGDYNKALIYCLKALEIKEDLNTKSYLGENLNNLGEIYFLLDKKTKALEYYKRALTESLILKEKKGEALTYKNLANLYYSFNNIDSALFYATKCYQLTNYQLSDIDLLMECCITNSKIFENLKDYKNAYKYQAQYKTIYDSIYDADFIGNLKNFELQAQYKSEKEIITKDLDRQKILLIKKQQQIRLMGVILLVITLTVFIFFYYYRQISKKNRKLFLQNLELVNIENCKEEKTDKKQILIEQETEKNTLKQIEFLMLSEKSYKDPTITLEGLATMLNTNRTYLSRIINDNYKCNFNKFINTYRVKEAREMLCNKEYKNLTFEAIANKVGFKSRSVFNEAFKEITGLTPSYFKKSAMNYPGEGPESISRA